MAQEERKIYKEERIEDIWTLAELKKYACPKVMHEREWYINCIDCQSRKTCRAGQQAYFLVTTETNPTPKTPEEKKRLEIIDIFSQKDPIRCLLQKCETMRPQSIYAKVSVWKKRYPDLEEKYKMIEKVRFLWRKPYDRMTVPDILKELYPETSEEQPYKSGVTLAHEAKELPTTDIAPNSKIYSVKPQDDYDGDSISIEDFLAEVNTEDITDNVSPIENEERMVSVMANPDMDALLSKLKAEKESYKSKIQEIDKQIDAILTVQKLMSAMKE